MSTRKGVEYSVEELGMHPGEGGRFGMKRLGHLDGSDEHQGVSR
jgi:hypothetical protein